MNRKCSKELCNLRRISVKYPTPRVRSSLLKRGGHKSGQQYKIPKTEYEKENVQWMQQVSL